MRIELRGRRRSSRSRCDGEPESRTGNGEAGRQTAAKRWWRGDAAAETRSGQGARRGLWHVDASLSLLESTVGGSWTQRDASTRVLGGFSFSFSAQGRASCVPGGSFVLFLLSFPFALSIAVFSPQRRWRGASSHGQCRFLASSIVFSLRSAWSWHASVHCARGLPVWLFVDGPVRQCQQPTRPPRLSPPCPVASGVFSLVVSGECSYCPPA